MSSEIALKAADTIAQSYDHYVSERGWIGPEMVFNLLEPHISEGMQLLDIGIGTGLCSLRFHEAGVKIYGLDGSAEMLKACASKNMTEELVQCDLTKHRFPYENGQFDFIISYGVFHIVGLIEKIFMEASMRLKNNGIFLFTIVETNPLIISKYLVSSIPGIYENTNEAGIINYCHDSNYIRKLINSSNLGLISSQTILAFKDPADNREVHFTIYVCRKNNPI